MLNRKSNGGHPEGAAAASTLPYRWTTLRVAPLRCSYPHPFAKVRKKNDINNKKNMLYNIKWKIKMIAKKLKMVAVLTDGDPSSKI